MTKTSEEMMRDLYISWFGVPDTDDHGAIYTLHEMEKHMRALNGNVVRNTAWRRILTMGLGVLISLVTYSIVA